MKLFAPSYYNKFKCIADKCRHSCCVGWEIDIDDTALCKYRALTHPYASEILKSIECGETPHFRLCEGECCPHLDENNLCRIILNLGDGFLCDICREHPRFYNQTKDGLEVGLGMACEEACRLILTSDGYGEMLEIGEAEGREEADYDSRVLRKRVYSLLSDRKTPYNQRLNAIYGEFAVSPSDISDNAWRELLSSLEYLDNAHRGLFSHYSSELFNCAEKENTLERALAYFVYRHCTAALCEDEFRAALGFCLFCERLLASLLQNGGEDAVTLARVISEELEYSEDNTEAIMFEFSV